jgi:hypothetical protein
MEDPKETGMICPKHNWIVMRSLSNAAIDSDGMISGRRVLNHGGFFLEDVGGNRSPNGEVLVEASVI